MSGCRFATHADIEDKPRLLRDLSILEGLTFSQYDAVVAATPSFMAWYTARPGMNPGLCQAVLCGEKLVSSLFVTVARMRLAGEMVVCGIVDTVMTHPAYRRRGLARGMLERAISLGPDEEWVVAWSWIRLGWIEDIDGNRESAVRAYQNAVSTGSTYMNGSAVARHYLTTPYEP